MVMGMHNYYCMATMVSAGYVAYEYPKYKRREVNKYVRKYADIENCISYEVMKYMMENAHLYPTLEMADNALSRYISQRGKCAVTHNALTVSDMVCQHIIQIEVPNKCSI